MSAWSTAFAGVDYEGLSHPQRQALVHRFEAALRLLDEHCRVYQYLLKRTVGPFVAAPCAAADRERGDPAPGGVPERPPRRPLRPVALPGAALRSPARRAAKHRACAASGRRPAQALRGWLSPDHALQLLESELDRAIGTLHHKAQAFEVQLGDFGPARSRRRTPSASSGELVNYDAGGRRCRPAHVRHAPRLLRRRTRPSTATATTCWSATASSRCCR